MSLMANWAKRIVRSGGTSRGRKHLAAQGVSFSGTRTGEKRGALCLRFSLRDELGIATALNPKP